MTKAVINFGTNFGSALQDFMTPSFTHGTLPPELLSPLLLWLVLLVPEMLFGWKEEMEVWLIS